MTVNRVPFNVGYIKEYSPLITESYTFSILPFRSFDNTRLRGSFFVSLFNKRKTLHAFSVPYDLFVPHTRRAHPNLALAV